MENPHNKRQKEKTTAGYDVGNTQEGILATKRWSVGND